MSLEFQDQFNLAEAGEAIWGPKQTAPDRLTYVTSPVFGDRDRAMRNRLLPGDIDPATGDARSELSGIMHAIEGRERWFRFPTLIEEWTSLDEWALIWQQHMGAGEPSIAMYMRQSALGFRLADEQDNVNYWVSDEILMGDWYDLVVGVLFSTDPEVGWIEVWLDGEQQTLENGETRMYGQTARDYEFQNYDKLGLYTEPLDPADERVVLHGMYLVGETRPDVMGGIPDTNIGFNLVEQHEPWITPDLQTYLMAIGSMFWEVELYSEDTEEFEGWTILLDVDRAPEEALPYLAQYVGERIPDNISEAAKREWIEDAPNQQRGTLGSIVAAARRYLIGERLVTVIERDGGVDKLSVVTYTEQTPDSGLVAAELETVVPADITLTYTVTPGQTWTQLDSIKVDWAEVIADYGSWADVTADTPEGTYG